jgi:hypothetical protein
MKSSGVSARRLTAVLNIGLTESIAVHSRDYYEAKKDVGNSVFSNGQFTGGGIRDWYGPASVALPVAQHEVVVSSAQVEAVADL